MKHKLSLIVLGGSGSKIKQIHLSATQFIVAGTVILVVLAAIVYGSLDYLNMRSVLADKSVLEKKLVEQGQDVQLQRQQIQAFAREINELKENIVSLNKFEKRIRILANLDQPGNSDGVFGVGGSAPDDLNPDVELKQSHQQLMKEMHLQMKQLGDASLIQEESFSHLLDKLEEQKNLLAHTPAIRPADGWITSTFSYRQCPFTGKREFHKGLDIANQRGTSIIATADGVVSYVGDKGSYGLVVVIDHGHGIKTRYAHLAKGIKKRGERVKRGEIIAQMGNSGRSTGPHLHYEVRLNGVPVNPGKYILN